MTNASDAGNDEFFRDVVEAAADLIARCTPDGDFLYASPAYERVLGYPPSSLAGRSAIDLLHPSDRADLRYRLSFAAVTGAPFTLTQRVRRADGAYLWLESLYSVVRDAPSAGVCALQIVSRDVSGRKQAEARRRRYVALSQEIFCALDEEGALRWVGRVFTQTLGWRSDEVVGHALCELVHPEDREQTLAALAQPGDGALLAIEHRILGKDGAYRWIAWQMTRDREHGGIYCAARDVTREREAERRLVHQAYHDSLTGLPNRTLFLTRLYEELLDAEAENNGLAVVLLDVDGFKLVNDSLGHVSGDALLAAVGRRLSAELRPADVLARFGSDEFMLLADGIDGREQALTLVAQLQAALDAPFTIGGRQHYVTVSAGVTLASYATTPERLLQEADAALYQAKAEGRGHVVVFEPEMRARAEAQLLLEADLRAALERRQLQIHYQPLVDLATGVVDGVEALTRWDHTLRRFVPPMEFIPLAEEVGLIVPLGAWVLAEACSEAAAWQRRLRRRTPLRVSVNISARQLRADLIATVREALAACAVDPSLLELELTETVIMDDPARALEILRALKDLGVRLAIDDFGTGYASLSYLSRLPVDVLKIDRSFVVAADHDPSASAIVRAVVALAHSLGVEVTAEGIETEAQLQYVREAGCDRGQGYLLGRPAPLADLDLRRRRVVTAPRRAARPLPLQRQARHDVELAG